MLQASSKSSKTLKTKIASCQLSYLVNVTLVCCFIQCGIHPVLISQDYSGFEQMKASKKV